MKEQNVWISFDMHNGPSLHNPKAYVNVLAASLEPSGCCLRGGGVVGRWALIPSNI